LLIDSPMLNLIDVGPSWGCVGNKEDLTKHMDKGIT
jgi:hypothetical protein